MAEKTWIKVHTGLVDDPKHAANMGERIWLFMYLINRADYGTGIVRNYKDRLASSAMNRPKSTIRKWRTALADAGYIVCHSGFQCLNIRIMRWLDPRKTNPKQVNIPGQEETWCPILDTHGTTLMDTHPLTQMDTPTLDSQESQDSTGSNGNNKAKKKPKQKIKFTKAQRDPVFDAVIEVTGLDRVTNAKSIGRLVTILLEAEYTAADVLCFGEIWYTREYPGGLRDKKRPTPGSLQKYIGWVREEVTSAMPDFSAGRNRA